VGSCAIVRRKSCRSYKLSPPIKRNCVRIILFLYSKLAYGRQQKEGIFHARGVYNLKNKLQLSSRAISCPSTDGPACVVAYSKENSKRIAGACCDIFPPIIHLSIIMARIDSRAAGQKSRRLSKRTHTTPHAVPSKLMTLEHAPFLKVCSPE
jgi:hypothetical protein